ncbi:MAG: hypothetical protein KJI72_04295 [Patescibacteria group bacterium]|nr:hypothetical protein [Patescibacteria group bacterium]
MKRILSILYLLLYLVINAAAMSDNSAPEFPLWFAALDLIIRSTTAVCILLYIIRYRPEKLRALWKLFPIALVLFELFAWYYELFVYADPSDTPLLITVVTIIVSIFIFPSWYMCFRFGYLKEVRRNSDNNTIDGELKVPG